MYYLYVHTMPNGKLYIGMTSDLDHRWSSGNGYGDNAEFNDAIEKFGWDNIKHEIIDAFEDKDICHLHEMIYITLFQTENPAFGYNKTDYYKELLSKYNSKTPYNKSEVYDADARDKNIFEVYNKPYDVGAYLIDQWIFDKRNRCIVKERMLDGATYDELSSKYGISVRQIKKIIYSAQDILVKHM